MNRTNYSRLFGVKYTGLSALGQIDFIFSSIQINLAVGGSAIDRWIRRFTSMDGTMNVSLA